MELSPGIEVRANSRIVLSIIIGKFADCLHLAIIESVFANLRVQKRLDRFILQFTFESQSRCALEIIYPGTQYSNPAGPTKHLNILQNLQDVLFYFPISNNQAFTALYFSS